MSIETILVVDDSDAEQFLCRHVINSFDKSITILKACDGIEALELLDGMDVLPDVILLDINMPRMNGLEFLEHFSEKYSGSAVKLAMLSSSIREKSRVMAYECVTTYLEKPLSKDHISLLSADPSDPG